MIPEESSIDGSAVCFTSSDNRHLNVGLLFLVQPAVHHRLLCLASNSRDSHELCADCGLFRWLAVEHGSLDGHFCVLARFGVSVRFPRPRLACAVTKSNLLIAASVHAKELVHQHLKIQSLMFPAVTRS